MENTEQKSAATLIIEKALKCLGETETPNNSGFVDKAFEAAMKSTGWQKGESWCCYFTELIWKEAYAGNDFILKELDRLFSASATKTYSNFRQSGFKVSPDPVPGALILFQHGHTWMGHAGIVVDIAKDFVITVEGNTNTNGSREGTAVCQKTRKLNQPQGPGLNILGFVHPA